MKRVCRVLRGAEYHETLARIVFIPLLSGLCLSWLIGKHMPLLGIVILIVSVVMATWSAHWIGWLRSPTVVTQSTKPTARTTMTKRNTGSHTRLAIVSSVTLLIMIAAACPPGDGTTPPDDKAEQASGETDGQDGQDGQDRQVSEENTDGVPRRQDGQVSEENTDGVPE